MGPGTLTHLQPVLRFKDSNALSKGCIRLYRPTSGLTGEFIVENQETAMRAWLMESYDGVEKLRLAEVADPQPGPGQALLRVRFAALNPADAFLARGMYPARPPLPHILGRDGVGEVLAVSPDVTTVRVGETVGILRGVTGVDAWGTLAEKVVVPITNLVAVPPGWSLEEMAGAPLVFLTAWQALTQWTDPPAPPDAGSVLLVTGASGGVGVASVLLGKSMHLSVVALSRSAKKGAKLKELGADFVFNPEDPHLRKTVLAAIAPNKVDLAVDNVGGALFNEVVAMLGHRGRISVVGRSGGVVPEFNTATLFFRRNRIGGVSVGDYGPGAAQAAWKQICSRLDAMGKRPVVDSVFRFEEVKEAFARLAQGPMGKVLIRVAG
jgi:NADPH:quinone reductase